MLGTGKEVLNAYDYLMQNGVDICCFVDENYNGQLHFLFGKKILRPLEAQEVYKNPIFIDCNSRYGALGVD